MSSRLAAALFGSIALLLAAIVLASPLVFGLWSVTPAPQKPVPLVKLEGRVTEAEFQTSVEDDLKRDPVQANIWRGTRSDHRLIVHAILACKKKLNEMTSMPVEMFSGLLLDLTPSGGHVLSGATKPNTGTAAQGDGASAAFELEPAERRLLSLSDSISRARLLSVSEVSQALPNAIRLWWIILLVSGLATLFVTLQTKLRRPGDDVPPAGPKPEIPPAGEKQNPGAGASDGPSKTYDWQLARQRRRAWLRQKWSFEFVAFMAVALSIMGTTLTALKQYYDPTRALVQNEHALRELRKLHQEIVLGVTCTNGTISYGEDAVMDGWSKRMADLQAEIVPPYAAVGGSTNQAASPAR